MPVFNQYFYMIFGKENWQALCAAEPEFAKFAHDGDNNGMVAFNSDTNRIYVWFKDISVEKGGTLAHECVHLAKRILEARGIKSSDEEMLSHLVGWLHKEMRPYFE